MSRVLSTEQAKAAIQQIQSIINGGLTDQIS
ncbi:pyrophosphorylase, partial [Schaalia canis]